MLPAVLTDNSKTILAQRYIDKVHDKTVDGLWDRVSLGNPEYRRLMSELLFLPNSPTMFNMGLPTGGTSSACFVFDLEDTLLGDWPTGGLPEPFITSILGTMFKAACVAKAGGGVGYYLGNLRPEGAEVKSTHKKACGPVTVLRFLNFLRTLITQGGKRDLAQMGVLDAHHPDIRKFIHVKDIDPQALGSFNISVSWRNEYLNQVCFEGIPTGGGNDWTQIWWEQCESAWKSGCPGNLFWDTINADNATPHLGNINATNPCGETPNINDEPCNLGSLAVCRYLIDHGPHRAAKHRFEIDWDHLKADTRTAIRFLDDILDNNAFPHPNITKMALETRKLGLGVMGLADLFAILGVPYDSAEAVNLSSELAAHQKEVAAKASLELAEQKGAYPAWKTMPRELRDAWRPYRNSTRTSIAPTGTIAIIAGVWGSIEPYFAAEAERTTYEGIKLADGIPDWVKAILHETGHSPKVASEVHWRYHVRHQAAWQKHTDLGVSKTINMPNDATVKDVSDAYRFMWETGCKGGTIFRDGCREEQVLVKRTTRSVYSTAKPEEPGRRLMVEPGMLALPGDLTPEQKAEFQKYSQSLQRYLALPSGPDRRKKLPDERPSVTRKFHLGRVKGYLTVGLFPDGSPGEVFINIGKQGSTLDGLVDTWAITLSAALQNGVPLEDLVKRHAGTSFEPNGLTQCPEIPVATSIPDFVVRWLDWKFGKKNPTGEEKAFLEMQQRTPKATGHTGKYCPDCNTELHWDAGCYVCRKPGCGFSKCG
jgi:ribonucleoside-diphosphate reductase alpha chain